MDWTVGPSFCTLSSHLASYWNTCPFGRGLSILKGFPSGSDGKASACNAGDLGLTPVSERSPGGGNGNPLQYSCLENPIDREAWCAAVHGVVKSWTPLSNFTLSILHCCNLPQSLLTQSLFLYTIWFPPLGLLRS